MSSGTPSHHVCVAPNSTDIPDAGSGGMPIGAVSLWSTAVAPSNWLLCDGSLVSRNTYSDLFAVVGTTWGLGDATPLAFTSTTATVVGQLVINTVTSAPSYMDVGTVFTMTGGKAGYSGYVWTSVGLSAGNIVATATTSAGVPVIFALGTDNTPGTVVVTVPTLFALPNTGNKVMRGANSFNPPNTQGGSDTTNITIGANNLPQHTHTTYGSNSQGALLYNSAGLGLGTPGTGNFIQTGQVLLRTDIGGTRLNDGTTVVTNSAIAVTTTNPFVMMAYIIKYF